MLRRLFHIGSQYPKTHIGSKKSSTQSIDPIFAKSQLLDENISPPMSLYGIKQTYESSLKSIISPIYLGNTLSIYNPYVDVFNKFYEYPQRNHIYFIDNDINMLRVPTNGNSIYMDIRNTIEKNIKPSQILIDRIITLRFIIYSKPILDRIKLMNKKIVVNIDPVLNWTVMDLEEFKLQYPNIPIIDMFEYDFDFDLDFDFDRNQDFDLDRNQNRTHISGKIFIRDTSIDLNIKSQTSKFK